jgi:hypothetical protein
MAMKTWISIHAENVQYFTEVNGFWTEILKSLQDIYVIKFW